MSKRVLWGIFLSSVLFAGCGGTVNNSNPAANQSANGNTSPGRGGTEAKAVKVTSPDGVVLVGTFLESARPNSPGLLLLHQWQSDRHSYDDFANRMRAKGFNVLAIDGRGFGESTKTSDGKTVTAGRSSEDVKAMLGDVDAAFELLSRQKNVDPNRIGIVGASYGSSLAIIYAADNPKVAAVVLLSPGLNYFGNMQTEPAIKKYGDRPLYLIAAEDDKESADAVRQLAAAGNNPKYSDKIYPKGGHGTGLFGSNDPQGLAEILERFFTDGLGAANNTAGTK